MMQLSFLKTKKVVVNIIKNNNRTCFFIKNPNKIVDLMVLHNYKERRTFEIEKTIELLKYEYNNFIRNFHIDRWYIHEYTNLCYIDDDEIWHCLLVKEIEKNDGILVQSDGCIYAKYAAYYHGNSD